MYGSGGDGDGERSDPDCTAQNPRILKHTRGETLTLNTNFSLTDLKRKQPSDSDQDQEDSNEMINLRFENDRILINFSPTAQKVPQTFPPAYLCARLRLAGGSSVASSASYLSARSLGEGVACANRRVGRHSELHTAHSFCSSTPSSCSVFPSHTLTQITTSL